ncbi:hypothetical protein CU669_08370 [Paramagnetospirillum kuznetsovii]|uniref:SF3 helicase domain-containing protein n=1 Tax=Paramagnetospirillum kuznetsovii TaxID=2053833 RepID=A0A364P0J4_9PROT|nr:phage/plasmid primase, P4 family [Paramagnetospirillum kuznetsovii]RAU22677.1 hypothetical protein CU669_08370 [Paramagnetospirillum kuznetsovii]
MLTRPDAEDARPQGANLGDGEEIKVNGGEDYNNGGGVTSQPANDASPGPRGIFADTAPRLRAAGLSVLPLWPKQKKPALLDWSRFCNVLADDDEFVAWMTHHAGGNIGLACGPASGLVAFDVDTVNGELVKIIETVAPASPWRRVGAKGWVGLYRYKGEKTFQIRDEKGGTICELLSLGRQVVLPPSIHPDTGRVYTANMELAGYMEGGGQFPDLPDDFEAKLREALGVPHENSGRFELPTTMGAGGKHNPLVSRAAQLASLHYDADVLFQILLTENLERCQPPLPEGEVRDIAAWACNRGAVIVTDQDAAEEFAKMFHRDHRYGGGVWWSWNGNHWGRDDGGVERAVRVFTRAMEHRAQSVQDGELRGKLVKAARKFQAAGRHDAILKISKTELVMSINPVELDANPWLLNLANGVVDLTSGMLRPVQREDLVSKMVGIMFDPDARCPTWERCLNEWFQGDVEMVAYVRRCVGYILTGHNREQVFFLLTGAGRNGKSVFLKIVRALVDDYAVAVSRKVMLATGPGYSTGPTPELVAIMGARLGTFSEIDKAATFNTEMLKGLVGDDRINGRLCHENQVEFYPILKLVIATNPLPKFDGADYAFVQRLHLWKFDHVIPEDQRDPELVPKLMAELAGILNWAIAGCLEWQRVRLSPPKKVMEARDKYAAEMDRVGCFLADHCTREDGAKVKRSALYQLYRFWCSDMGYGHATLQQFAGDLERKGVVAKKTAGEWYFLGVGQLGHGVGHV